MEVMARKSRKKSWQTGRQRVSVQAALAIQRENVMQRLVRLRADIGHPEKPGEPLPQDQAAARAGVTARQWQRWESGASVPYARNLSAVADAFKFNVAEFYDGPAGQQAASTPDPFPPVAIEGVLGDVLREINDQLAEQTRVLEEIKTHAAATRGLVAEQQRVRAETEAATRDLLAAVDAANRALLADSPQSATTPSQPAK